MPQIVLKKLPLQLCRIHQVAVMSEHDAKRGVNVERLRFSSACGRSSRRVATMGDAHVAGEAAHIAGTENVAHQTFVLVHVECASVGSDDTGSILPAMLQHRQAVIQELIDRTFGNDSNDTAHGKSFIDSSLFAPHRTSSLCSCWWTVKNL